MNKMLTKLLFFAVFWAANPFLKSQDINKNIIEYASVRFDGELTCITWQDGSVQKVSNDSKSREIGNADPRIWHLTVAMNIMSKKGFVAIYIDNRDVMMMRTSKYPKREYAAVRFSGKNTSIVWPDGKSQSVLSISGQKSHEPADIRLWYLTVASNAMGKSGFQPTQTNRDSFWRMDSLDIWMEKLVE